MPVKSHTSNWNPKHRTQALIVLALIAPVAQAFEVPPMPSSTPKPAKPKAPSQDSKPAATPTSSHGGKLVIEADADCELRVNGEKKQTLAAGEAKVITLDAGEQLLECTSTRYKDVKVRKVQMIEIGKQTVSTLQLANAVNDAAASEAAQAQAHAQAQAKARSEAEAQAKAAARYSNGPSGTLIDNTTGLQWSQSDNGSDINWNEATRYCQGKGSGWGLPTVAQLHGIYDETQSQICDVGNCRVSPKFRLTDYVAWSNQPHSPWQAYSVVLTNALRNYNNVEDRKRHRALCVRRP